MFDFRRVPLPDYSRFEDGVNSVTHAVGVPFAAAAAVLLFKKFGSDITTEQKICTLIYAVSMFIVFFGSAFYHGLKPGYKKQVARVLDHSNIFLMISGTVTAFSIFAVKPLNHTMGIVLPVVVWAASAVGIFLNFLDLDKFKWLQLVMYVALGWSAVIGMFPIWKTGDAGKTFVYQVFIGGACFTLGALLYVVGKKHKYFHAVFHVFVLAGAVVMFTAMYRYI